MDGILTSVCLLGAFPWRPGGANTRRSPHVDINTYEKDWSASANLGLSRSANWGQKPS